jgi:TetR/AcrR family transcriptional regulator, lmrAB and yxaGH operons repressor
MPAPALHRDAIVRAAATLFRRDGYAATGTNAIVRESGAPKGSLYHYFPGGKEEIAVAAVEHAGGVVARTLTALVADSPTPGAALRAYGRLVAGWLADSGYRDGCPIATTLLETAPGSPACTAAGRAAFDAWAEVLAGGLRDHGVAGGEATRLGRLAVVALEGALVVARVEQDGAAVVASADAVADLFDGAVSGRTAAR